MRRGSSKTALVLAGGGLTGAVYEIGALRAIDDLLIDRTVNDFDIYVGTSAGALVGAVLANGLSPEMMMQVMAGSHPEVRALNHRDVFSLGQVDLIRWGWQLPRTMVNALSHYLRHLSDMNLFDVLWSLSEALPSGIYDSLALESYVRQTLGRLGCHNHFADLDRELYIIATDLDTGRRAVFGKGYHEAAPISMAVAASTALPVLYKPLRIGHNDYVDGGVRGTASLDLAIEHGAKLAICINPLVPYDNSDRESIPFLGPDGGNLSEKGLQAIAAQVSRIYTHAGLHYHIKQLRRSHPDVDIILIEPSADDAQMFFYNIMRYSTRLIVAQHGFESVTLDLAEDYPRYKDILARHGIDMTRRLVIEELNAIRQSGYDPTVVRQVLESPSSLSRRSINQSVSELDQTLAELERVLADMASGAA